jgi:predicted AlkP superfamily phosphohydrolase/phosphomutase
MSSISEAGVCRARSLRLVAWLVLAVACAPSPRTTRPLVVLAVDGLDPRILTRLIANDRLPHLAELARGNGLVRVTSTPGAESASAWTSWATGTSPGRHGVFDLIAPDAATGRPVAATLRPRASSRWFGALLREGAAYRTVREGTPFWTHLGARGLRSRVLFVPGTFPPEPIPSGRIVAGSPLPDLGGGFGTGYTWLASDVAADRVGYTRFGGRIERLAFTRNVAHATLVGLRAPHRIDIPFAVAWNPEARSANVTIGDDTVHLMEGQRSRWITVSVWLTPLTRVWGLTRAQLVKAGNDVQVYVSPIQWHPVSPPSPIAAPPGHAPTLYARLGPFRTLAWPEAAWAVADGYLPVERFDEAQEETMADRTAAILSEAQSADWDLLVAGIETLEATTRLRWRGADGPGLGDDAITRAYEQLDALVGDLQVRLPPDAGLVIASAFGVTRASRVVDLNRWLTTAGWLHWREPPPPVTMAVLADAQLWTDTVDASKTVARAMGSGHIYVRLPPATPGTDAPRDRAQVLQDLQSGLEALTDPLSGRHVVAAVRTADTAFGSDRRGTAPDLVVTLVPGYRWSWDTVLGGMGPVVVADNDERWTADHAGVDEGLVPGVWLSNLPLEAETISVLDLAPTVAAFFGVQPPAEAEGRSQLRSSASSPSRR